MDPTANNFKESAEEDDGSCTYTANMVFWYNNVTANLLDVQNVTSVEFFLDGKTLGSQPANVSWVYAPDCGETGSIGTSKVLLNTKSKSFPYVVKDQNSNDIWSGEVTLIADSCLTKRLSL